MSQTYGYIRVSSKDQNEDRQVLALSEYNIDSKHIYMDKLSGKNFERPSYKKMLIKLNEKDVLIIKSIDRLGRNYDEILEQWRILTKEKKVFIKVIDMPLLDTGQGRDLTGTLIADIFLQLLSYVAQCERENIHQRQKEGIMAAKKRGVRFGRPEIKKPSFSDEVTKKWHKNEISSREAARLLKVSQSTFLNWVRKSEQKSRHKNSIFHVK